MEYHREYGISHGILLGYMLQGRLITGDVDLDHMVKEVSAKFLYHEVTFYPLLRKLVNLAHTQGDEN